MFVCLSYRKFGSLVETAIGQRQTGRYELEQREGQREATHHSAAYLEVPSEHFAATSVVDIVCEIVATRLRHWQ